MPHHFSFAAGLAAAAIIASATAALAIPAVAYVGTTLYSSPGGDRIGYVPRGQWVEVNDCAGGFCFIHRPGNDGFVEASAIGLAGVGDNRFGNRGYGGWDWPRHHRHHPGHWN